MCQTVELHFSTLNPAIPSTKIIHIIIAAFLFFLIQSLASSTKIKAIPSIADLDNVINIASIQSPRYKKFIFDIGFLKIFFSFLIPVFHQSSTSGKNAIKKYP